MDIVTFEVAMDNSQSKRTIMDNSKQKKQTTNKQNIQDDFVFILRNICRYFVTKIGKEKASTKSQNTTPDVLCVNSEPPKGFYHS